MLCSSLGINDLVRDDSWYTAGLILRLWALVQVTVTSTVSPVSVIAVFSSVALVLQLHDRKVMS